VLGERHHLAFIGVRSSLSSTTQPDIFFFKPANYRVERLTRLPSSVSSRGTRSPPDEPKRQR
jgi:hypothetical protein